MVCARLAVVTAGVPAVPDPPVSDAAPPPAGGLAAGVAAVVVATVTLTVYTPARSPAVSQSNWSDGSEKVSGWLVWKGPCTCQVNVFC